MQYTWNMLVELMWHKDCQQGKGSQNYAIEGNITKQQNKMMRSVVITDIPKKYWMSIVRYMWILILCLSMVTHNSW